MSQRPDILTPLSFVALGDGTFRAIPKKPVEMVAVMEAAKMTGLKKDNVYKLYYASFIKGTQASPRKLLIQMDTLTAHIEAATAPDFWTKERHLRYFGTLPRAARQTVA